MGDMGPKTVVGDFAGARTTLYQGADLSRQGVQDVEMMSTMRDIRSREARS